MKKVNEDDRPDQESNQGPLSREVIILTTVLIGQQLICN